MARVRLMNDEQATRRGGAVEETIQRGALERHIHAERNIARIQARRRQEDQEVQHLVQEEIKMKMKAIEQKKENERLLVARRLEEREEKERQLRLLIEQLKEANAMDHLQQVSSSP